MFMDLIPFYKENILRWAIGIRLQLWGVHHINNDMKIVSQIPIEDYMIYSSTWQ